MKVAIASGKGGTGKTTVAVNLAFAMGSAVTLLDCDVEEPNAHLFVRGAPLSREPVQVPAPVIDESRCDGCGECGRFCAWHAIVALKGAPLVFPELCHGCGGCVRVCPRGAISERPRRIGYLDVSSAGRVTLASGCLDVGEAMAPPLIRAVLARAQAAAEIVIDAPPGASCPMVAAVRGADAALLVAEPTPFGLHDLRIAVETVRSLGVPFGVVVNRADSGDDGVRVYCAGEGVPIFAEIPNDRRIAEAYSRGERIIEAVPEYGGFMARILAALRRMQSPGG